MRIRSVTVFGGSDWQSTDGELARLGTLAGAVKARMIDAGYEVQTTRLALPPVREWLGAAATESALLRAAKLLDGAASAHGFDYVSIGPISAAQLPVLPQLIAETNIIFSSIAMAGAERTLSTGMLPALADAILAIAKATPNGFGNLRFCASANCNSGIPFFPAAYSSDALKNTFALAMESADLALEACRDAASTSAAMGALTRGIEEHSRKMATALEPVAAGFGGFDWSLAPHPDASRSIGAALEALSGTSVGGWGTLTAVAAMTRAIRRAKVRHVGFSGIFLPVLEDAVLAQHAAENSYDLPRLLLYSAVCGAGLDTIPLPGTVSAEAISALLADVATLAVVLDKPLTARLMPVPGLQSGQRTMFEFPYLVNATPLELQGAASKLFRDENLWLGM